jgi:hypothetical protein
LGSKYGQKCIHTILGKGANVFFNWLYRKMFALLYENMPKKPDYPSFLSIYLFVRIPRR